MFVEPQQRFTIRKESTTIGTGVFLEVLPPCTEQEKDRRLRKKLMRSEMERLGYNPYGERMERILKPDYSKSGGRKENDDAKLFEGQA
jgi:hypothetical protein